MNFLRHPASRPKPMPSIYGNFFLHMYEIDNAMLPVDNFYCNFYSKNLNICYLFIYHKKIQENLYVYFRSYKKVHTFANLSLFYFCNLCSSLTQSWNLYWTFSPRIRLPLDGYSFVIIVENSDLRAKLKIAVSIQT